MDDRDILQPETLLTRDMRLNHWVSVTGGVLAEECGAMLAGFFADRR